MVKPAYDAPLDSFIPGNKNQKKKLLVRKPSNLVNDPLKTSPTKPKVSTKARNEKKIVKAKPKPNKSTNRVQKNRPQQKPKVVVQKVIEKIVYVNEKGQKVPPPKSVPQQNSQAVVSRTRTQRRRDSRAKLANQKSTLTKVTSSQGEISVVTDLRKQIEVRKKQHGTVEKKQVQKKPAQVKKLVKKNKPKEEPKKLNRNQKKQVLKTKKKQVKEEIMDSDDDYEQVSRPVKTTQRAKRKERVLLEEGSNGALTDNGLKRWKNDQFIGDARNRIPSRENDISKTLISTKFGIKNDVMVMPKKLREDEMVEVEASAVSYFHRISNSDGNDRPAHSKTIPDTISSTTRIFH